MDISPEAAELAAEFVRRNSAGIVDFGKNLMKGASHTIRLRLPQTYESYLTSSASKYGRAKSFFIRNAPTNIYEFYVPLGLSCGDMQVSKVSYREVAKLANRAVVTGAAGSGKSMLMRHLFLSALLEQDKVPVFVELRNANTDQITLFNLITKSLEDHGFNLGESYIKKALIAGHFAIFLDGYDEVSYPRREKLAEEITDLSRKAEECTIMISSRPDDIFVGWGEFSRLLLNPLDIDEAGELIEKLPFDKDLKGKFLEDLRGGLFDRHESFLSNPLLLSIMLLTYGQSAEIPGKLSIFYNQAYEALFQKHDALKGGFQRDRLCSLDIQDFSRVFSAFCLQTYDRRLFQFTRSDALGYLDKAKKLVGIEVDSSDFLEDALQSVCMLVEDGLLLVFAHRSFQEYFVARFIGESAPSIQRRLINRFWENVRTDSVLHLLAEINLDLVERDLVVPKLNDMFENIGVRRKIGITHFTKFFKSAFAGVSMERQDAGDTKYLLSFILFDEAGYFDLVSFVIKIFPDFARSISRDVVRAKSQSLCRRFLHGEEEASCSSSSLTYRSTMIEELSTLDGYFSASSLQALYLWKKKLEAKHKRAGQSLEELLL